MKNKRKVLLISESNFLLDVAFERRKDCLYLRDLAVAEELQLVIPEYAFAEVEAKWSVPKVFFSLPLPLFQNFLGHGEVLKYATSNRKPPSGFPQRGKDYLRLTVKY
jgi:hypothetical protein